MPIEVKKSKIVTKTVEIKLSSDDVAAAVVAAIRRDHKELKDYSFDLLWTPAAIGNDGVFATVTGTSASGGEG